VAFSYPKPYGVIAINRLDAKQRCAQSLVFFQPSSGELGSALELRRSVYARTKARVLHAQRADSLYDNIFIPRLFLGL
jgi:hypothetical protein